MAYRTTKYFSIFSLQMEHRSATSLSISTIGTNGTNRQIVHAQPSGVNICSLQMEHRSAVSCSNGTIGTNGTNRQIVHARLWGVNICSLKMEYRSAASFSNGANRTASLTNGDFLPMVPLVRVSWRLVSVCVYWTCVPCSSAVYSHLTTINSALASHPIVSPTAFPSLTALPLQQPFMIGPGYSPVPFKVVSQITAGKFVNLEDWLAENITMHKQDPQLWFNGQLVLLHTPKKWKHIITDTASWMEAFSIFYLILCSSFPYQWRDLTSYKLLILRAYRQFSGFCWLVYDWTFREHTTAEKVTNWSKMHVQLFSYHTAGAQVCTRPTSSSVVSSQAETFGNASSKVICHSWNTGILEYWHCS